MRQSFSTSRPDQSNLVGPTQFGPAPVPRDPADAARSLIGRDPDAQYPAGYVDSALTTRRSNPYDSSSLWNQKGYARGVHAFSKLPTSAYTWPAEFNLGSALENQMLRSQPRYVAPEIAAGGEPKMLVNEGRPGPMGQAEIDPITAQRLGRVLPSWS